MSKTLDHEVTMNCRWSAYFVVCVLIIWCFPPTLPAEESNRNEIRRELSGDGWTVVWGKNFTEADWAEGTYAMGQSIATENPAPFLRWFTQVLDENFSKIQGQLVEVSRRDLEQWVLQSLQAKQVITYRGLRLEAGFATYQRWNRIVYDEPRTRRVKTKLPFGGWTYTFESYLERVERKQSLPNWHQFYIRYQIVPNGVPQIGGGYRSNFGNVTIQQTGNQIAGTVYYPNGGTGAFSGSISGPSVFYRWRNNATGETGTGNFRISAGQLSGEFQGNFGNRGTWSLSRN